MSGQWASYEGNNGRRVTGVVVRVTGYGDYDLWVGNTLVRCPQTRGRITAVQLLDRMAVEAGPDYRDPPDLPLCHNDECFKFIPPNHTAVYCTNQCALMDA